MTKKKTHCYGKLLRAMLALGLMPALVFAQTQSIDHLRSSGSGASGRKPPEWSYDTGYDPYHQKPISAVGHYLSLTLTKSEGCPSRPREWRCFAFKVSNREGKIVSEFKLDNDTGQVDEAHIVSVSRAVVIGRSGQSIVNVIDFKKRKVIDSFVCFYPSVSPDGQLVAYNKWFPLHPDPYHPSTEYYIYDLTKSPEQNRMKPEPNQTGTPSPFDAGWPVYPTGAGRNPGSNLIEDPAMAHGMVSRGIFWLGQEHIFSFVDQWLGANKIVIVDVTQGIREPRLTEKPINPNDIVDSTKAVECSRPPGSSFYVIDMYVPEDRPGLLDMQLGSFVPKCLRRSTMEISLTRR